MPTRLLPLYFALFLASHFVWAETYFEVLDNEANSFIGTITTLDRTQIVVDSQGKTQAIPLEKLVRVRNLAPNPYAQVGKETFPASVIALELKEGTRLTASSFTVDKSQGICRLLDKQSDLSIPLESISAVRFAVRNLQDVINPPADWLRLAVPSADGDRLIVGNPGSFDVYAGVLKEINAETIFFDVDGEVLPVPRRKVYGFLLHGDPNLSSGVSPLATLVLWTGTRGMISDLRLVKNELTWQTQTGLAVTVPLNNVDVIDFGEQGVAYLFDFEKGQNEFSLSFAPNIKLEQFNALQTFYERRIKEPREIVLDGTAYSRGVTLLGKTSLEYRLPKPFAALKAVIGIEDQFRPNASAMIQILADSRVLGTWELRGDTTSQQIHINLPQNCRLITIRTEPLPQSNIPAVLSIADAKLFE